MRIKDFFKFPKTRRRESASAGVPAYVLTAGQGTSGAYVGTAAEAMSIAAVYRCVSLLSESVANLPFELLERDAEGLLRPSRRWRLGYLLGVAPNEDQSVYDFWIQALTNYLLHGNAYILPQCSSVSGDYSRLTVLSPGSVSYDYKARAYTVNDETNGIFGTYGESEIIHLRNTALDGRTGIGIVTWARMTLGIAATGEQETQRRFASGGNVRGFVSNEAGATGYNEYADDELEKLAQKIGSTIDTTGGIFSIPGSARFTQLSQTSADLEFLATRRFSVNEICRFFGVDPSFVFEPANNNYKSAEMANVAFLTHTLDPLLKRIESEFNRKLLSEKDSERMTFRFDRSGIYACDLITKAQWQKARIESGIDTPNEARRSENKSAIEGGDTLLVSANLRPISQINETETEL